MVDVPETTIQDKIKIALDGRTQNWLVLKIIDYGLREGIDELIRFTDVKLSRRMKGMETFTPTELKAISKILKIKL